MYEGDYLQTLTSKMWAVLTGREFRQLGDFIKSMFNLVENKTLKKRNENESVLQNYFTSKYQY